MKYYVEECYGVKGLTREREFDNSEPYKKGKG
jgi:hypothetical protein